MNPILGIHVHSSRADRNADPSTVSSPCHEAVHAPLLMTLSGMSRPTKCKSTKTTISSIRTPATPDESAIYRLQV